MSQQASPPLGSPLLQDFRPARPREERESLMLYRAALVSLALRTDPAWKLLRRVPNPEPPLSLPEALGVLGLSPSIVSNLRDILNRPGPVSGRDTERDSLPYEAPQRAAPPGQQERAQRMALTILLEATLLRDRATSEELLGAIGRAPGDLERLRANIDDLKSTGGTTPHVEREVTDAVMRFVHALPPVRVVSRPVPLSNPDTGRGPDEGKGPDKDTCGPGVATKLGPLVSSASFFIVAAPTSGEIETELDFASDTLVTTVGTTSYSTLGLDKLKELLDPQNWSRSPFWLTSDRIIRGEQGLEKSAIAIGSTWDPNIQAWCFEHVRWEWNSNSIAEFQNLLNIKFEEVDVPGEIRKGVELRFTLHSCLGSLLYARFARDGVDVDNGFLRATPVTLEVTDSSGNQQQVDGYRIETQKSIRFSEIEDKRTSFQGMPGTSSLLSLLAPATVQLWMRSLVQSIYDEEANPQSLVQTGSPQ